jgi:hypothetical protein
LRDPAQAENCRRGRQHAAYAIQHPPAQGSRAKSGERVAQTQKQHGTHQQIIE